MLQLWQLGFCVALTVVLLLIPAPAGLPLVAWQIFALYLGAMAGLMLRPFPEPVIFLLAIGSAGVVLSTSKEDQELLLQGILAQARQHRDALQIKHSE